MASSMKAIDIKGGKGDATALFINPATPKPTATTGQAIIKVTAFGVNRVDITQRRGLYPVPPHVSKTLGLDFSGVIESLGPDNDSGFVIGDEVFGMAVGGAYAEFVVINTKLLIRKPTDLSFETAAAIPVTWLTAIQALHVILDFKKGKSILWHAGASGLSIAGIQLSRLLGASTVFATAGSDEKCKFVEELGATVFNYKTQDWVKEIQGKTEGSGVDYIIDVVAGDYLQKNISVAARDGRILQLGLLSGGTAEKVDVSQIFFKRLRIEGSTLRSRDAGYQKQLRDVLATYLDKFVVGELKVYMDSVRPWEEIRAVHEYMEQDKSRGKMVCTITEG